MRTFSSPTHGAGTTGPAEKISCESLRVYLWCITNQPTLRTSHLMNRMSPRLTIRCMPGPCCGEIAHAVYDASPCSRGRGKAYHGRYETGRSDSIRDAEEW